MSHSTGLFNNSEDGPCACSQLRRAARKLSVAYDRALEPAGITVTQYALLVNVARAGQISRTALATQVGMDRTTLTRNLIPLERAGLLAAGKSDDRRERLIQLSSTGLDKVRQSFTLWRAAQRKFISQMGPVKLKQFRATLTIAEDVAGTL